MADHDINELLEQQFPTLGKMIYVNHAALSPWPRVTREAVCNFAAENNESGPMGTGRWLITERRLRERIAHMLGAGGGEDIALLQNTSTGICAVANGIAWRAGDNLVMPAGEFISNQMPWDALEAQGVEIRKVEITGRENAETALISAMDAHTRVVTVSAVQWDSGFRLDLEKLGLACSDSQALFFVDAIQAFPALQIDVEACRIDALAASAHKWQMGPEGIALLYCRESCRQTLSLKQHGWRMLDDPYRFDRPDLLASSSAQRFEPGSPNTMGQAALYASLGLFCDVGLVEVEARILANTAQIIDALSQISAVKLVSHTDIQRRSGIVSFLPGDTDPDIFCRNMASKKVFVAVRGQAIRLSPHFYQAGQPIERLLGMLEDEILKL